MDLDSGSEDGQIRDLITDNTILSTGQDYKASRQQCIYEGRNNSSEDMPSSLSSQKEFSSMENDYNQNSLPLQQQPNISKKPVRYQCFKKRNLFCTSKQRHFSRNVLHSGKFHKNLGAQLRGTMPHHVPLFNNSTMQSSNLLNHKQLHYLSLIPQPTFKPPPPSTSETHYTTEPTLQLKPPPQLSNFFQKCISISQPSCLPLLSQPQASLLEQPPQKFLSPFLLEQPFSSTQAPINHTKLDYQHKTSKVKKTLLPTPILPNLLKPLPPTSLPPTPLPPTPLLPTPLLPMPLLPPQILQTAVNQNQPNDNNQYVRLNDASNEGFYKNLSKKEPIKIMNLDYDDDNDGAILISENKSHHEEPVFIIIDDIDDEDHEDDYVVYDDDNDETGGDSDGKGSDCEDNRGNVENDEKVSEVLEEKNNDDDDDENALMLRRKLLLSLAQRQGVGGMGSGQVNHASEAVTFKPQAVVQAKGDGISSTRTSLNGTKSICLQALASSLSSQAISKLLSITSTLHAASSSTPCTEDANKAPKRHHNALSFHPHKTQKLLSPKQAFAKNNSPYYKNFCVNNSLNKVF